MKAQSTSAIIDELNYRSYCQQRILFPRIPPERWVKIFPEWAAFEKRFVQQFVSCLILAAEDFEGLPTADGTKPSARMAQGADIGKSGEVSTASPLQQDSCGSTEGRATAIEGATYSEAQVTSQRITRYPETDAIADAKSGVGDRGSEYRTSPAGILSGTTIEDIDARVIRVMQKVGRA